MNVDDIRRIDFGYFVRPGEETATGRPRVEPCLGYVVRHSHGILLFDTGLGEGDADVDAHYSIHRRPVGEALADVGLTTRDVHLVANCHLHFDHCGGNPALSGRRIFVQRVELSTARTATDYTLPHLVDFTDAAYTELDGESEILPNVWALPTPGHTDGHQSLAVRCADGTVVLAGQAHDHATDYTASQLAWRAQSEGAAGPIPRCPPWIDRLQRFDPRRVVFAHDNAVWEPAGPLNVPAVEAQKPQDFLRPAGELPAPPATER